VGLTPYPVKKKIVEKPPRNSAGFCGGGQGLRWAVEPRRESLTMPFNYTGYMAWNWNGYEGKCYFNVLI
jgi:hypothetical protein